MVAAVAAASVGVFVAVAAAWAAVAVAGCAAADSSSLQDSFSVITDGLSTVDSGLDSGLSLTYGLMSLHQQRLVVSYNLKYLFLTLPNSSSWQSINIH